MQMEAGYRNLASGAEMLESQLRGAFPEYLNAEIVLRNVTDLAGAIAWLKSTFLYVRVSARMAARPMHACTYHSKPPLQMKNSMRSAKAR